MINFCRQILPYFVKCCRAWQEFLVVKFSDILLNVAKFGTNSKLTFTNTYKLIPDFLHFFLFQNLNHPRIPNCYISTIFLVRNEKTYPESLCQSITLNHKKNCIFNFSAYFWERVRSRNEKLVYTMHTNNRKKLAYK